MIFSDSDYYRDDCWFKGSTRKFVWKKFVDKNSRDIILNRFECLSKVRDETPYADAAKLIPTIGTETGSCWSGTDQYTTTSEVKDLVCLLHCKMLRY